MVPQAPRRAPRSRRRRLPKRRHPVIDGPFAETKEMLLGFVRKTREVAFAGGALDDDGAACREKER